MARLKKKSESEYYQLMFRSFLKALREEKNWTQQDLADALNVSLHTVEKFEGHKPTKVSDLIGYLKNFSVLKGISVNSFVSILMGKLNEEAEIGGAFSKELVLDIEKLDSVSQSRMKCAIKKSYNCDVSIDVFYDVSHTTAPKKKLYSLIEKLSEQQAKALVSLIGSF
jgi:transcriptional regulator with XRE-family HTH domain